MGKHLKLVPLTEEEVATKPLPGPLPKEGDGGHDGGMAEIEARLSKLEVAVAKIEAITEGIRHSQTTLMAASTGVAALLLALITYSLTRIDAIPGQVAAENRDIVKTLSDAITATKQNPPQVILLPAPQIEQQQK